MSELKPCPFCGEEARLKTSHSAGGIGGDGFYIQCSDLINCGSATDIWSNIDGLTKSWNTRPIEDTFRDALEKVSGALRREIKTTERLTAELDLERNAYSSSRVREQLLVSDIVRTSFELDKARAELAAAKAENERLADRVTELVEQADAAYAPYRQMVQDARAEVDKFSTENERLRKIVDWYSIERNYNGNGAPYTLTFGFQHLDKGEKARAALNPQEAKS